MTSRSLLAQWHALQQQGQQVCVVTGSHAAILFQVFEVTRPQSRDKDEDADAKRDEGDTSHMVHTLPKIYVIREETRTPGSEWKIIYSQLEELCALYASNEPRQLSERHFPEFQEAKTTWGVFQNRVTEEDLSIYHVSVDVITRLQERTPQAMELFKEHVLDKNYGPGEADVIFSTVHCAKGMQWDNVEVADEFVPVRLEPSAGANGGKGTRAGWQFNYNDFGNDVNALYVACTRAKKRLCIPPSMLQFISDCDTLAEFVKLNVSTRPLCGCLPRKRRTSDGIPSECRVFGQAVSVIDAHVIYAGVVARLRKEIKMDAAGSLLHRLVNGEEEVV